MRTRVLRIAITAADVAEAARRSHDEPLERCSPLFLALRRLGFDPPVFTRRYVLLGDETWEPSRLTKLRENEWALTGRATPGMAELVLRIPRGNRRRQELAVASRRPQSLNELRTAVQTWLEAFAAFPPD